MKKTLLIVTVVVLALGALGVGVAFAQGGNPPVTGWAGRMMGNRGGDPRPLHEYMEQVLADKLELTTEKVEEEIAAGKPPFQIALDNGIEQENLAAFMADVHKTALAAAVKDGVITQEQADFMLQRMEERGENFGDCPMGGGFGSGRGHGMMGGYGRGGSWQNQNQNP